MTNTKICSVCKGNKTVMGLGYITNKCNNCNGTGQIKPKETTLNFDLDTSIDQLTDIIESTPEFKKLVKSTKKAAPKKKGRPKKKNKKKPTIPVQSDQKA